MGHYYIRLLGGLVYWIITGFKKDKNECISYKYSFEIGLITITVVLLLYLYT